jgi:uncharacterized protein YgbK (DUF1537 family)
MADLDRLGLARALREIAVAEVVEPEDRRTVEEAAEVLEVCYGCAGCLHALRDRRRDAAEAPS